MRKLCPTCGGRGSIPDPKCVGIPMLYVGPNGEGCPYVPCQSCGMQGWVTEDHECCRCKCKDQPPAPEPPFGWLTSPTVMPHNPQLGSVYYPKQSVSINYPSQTSVLVG